MRRTQTHAREALAALTAAVLIPAGASAQPATAAANEVLQTKTGPISIERLTTLTQPWGMAFLPDGRLLITEKPGRLRIYEGGKLSEPIAGVPSVVFHGQGGLLDVEVDPAFASNSLVYLSYTEAAEVQPPGTHDVPDPRFGGSFDKEDNLIKGGAVARGRLDGQQLRDVKVIWRQVPKTIGRGHFGGRLVFAPDGKLFITSGDRMRFDPAQDPASNIGKIVRINPDGSNPADNPFANKAGARPDVWSMGHRNPLGAAINPASNQLWINEMGPRHGDELQQLVAPDDPALPVNRSDSVTVTVECHSEIEVSFGDKLSKIDEVLFIGRVRMMIRKLTIDFHKQKVMLTRQQLRQFFNRRSRRAVSSVPADAKSFRGCRFGYAGNILVKDIMMFVNTSSFRPIPCRRHRAELLDIAAKKWRTHKYHLEAVVIGGVMAAGYLYAAVHVIKRCLGII